MLFNSLDFAIFFPIVFIGYWFVFNKKLSLQNAFLLISSYYFYACWNWRFMFLLMFSTLLDYYTGKKIHNATGASQKKIWLWISILVNLGFLGFFKYFNFFVASFSDVFSVFGYKLSGWTLNIILPVGISFYTFHGLSYVIDIYKERIKPVNNIVDYSLFVSFFPLLVAGPIERATHLLPQIRAPRSFDYNLAVSGVRQILWGLFKKLVIADNCAQYANMAFNNTQDYNGSSLALGAVFFAFQIYGDFSGYTDMASGTSKLLGIGLIKNFSYPYFSRDIAEFWRRWHISLSSWFKDYVYIPLGGSRVAVPKQVRNVFVIFLLSGFWHGANLTFIAWGFLHACYFLPSLLRGTNKKNKLDTVAILNFKDGAHMLITFGLVVFAWIFFRAATIYDAFKYISILFSGSLFSVPMFFPKKLIAVLLFFIVLEWIGRKHEFALDGLCVKLPAIAKALLYYILLVLIFYFIGKEQQFIYFQF
ncbi:MBOAT family O-acyltransferase [Flavobacterium subsaxonicum]|uniref:Acyltransferase n=1 Tax=Flavobacterium subsaxonicum WB 4.1-42 = DSM 21790 TaxID=1121898 RepID=A0A0A2MIW6_9FLAO|nr:MBOAT family O-acyltransferase [Flavobacterium subsaxonicum]KGO92572.1 acyltransferase [Flavobacterium subsaxonicum WB 4.1-42 = DSM 21790]